MSAESENNMAEIRKLLDKAEGTGYRPLGGKE